MKTLLAIVGVACGLGGVAANSIGLSAVGIALLILANSLTKEQPNQH